MAIAAIEPVIADMVLVAEGNRLRNGIRHGIGRRHAPARYRNRDNDHGHYAEQDEFDCKNRCLIECLSHECRWYDCGVQRSETHAMLLGLRRIAGIAVMVPIHSRCSKQSDICAASSVAALFMDKWQRSNELTGNICTNACQNTVCTHTRR
jgi:hypothetical protein